MLDIFKVSGSRGNVNSTSHHEKHLAVERRDGGEREKLERKFRRTPCTRENSQSLTETHPRKEQIVAGRALLKLIDTLQTPVEFSNQSSLLSCSKIKKKCFRPRRCVGYAMLSLFRYFNTPDQLGAYDELSDALFFLIVTYL